MEVVEEEKPVEEPKKEDDGFFEKHTGLNTGTFIIILAGIIVFILLLGHFEKRLPLGLIGVLVSQ